MFPLRQAPVLAAIFSGALFAHADADAGERLQVVMEVRPTLMGMEKAGSPDGIETTVPQGQTAQPFLLRYDVDVATLSSGNGSSLSGPTLAFHTDAKTPWTDTVLPYAHYPAGPWDLDDGIMYVGSYYAMSGFNLTDVTLASGDGYDTMGVTPHQPSWLFYSRLVHLPMGSLLDPGRAIDTASLIDWFTAQQDRVVTNGFSEQIYRYGGVRTNFVKGDLVIKSVTAVPEPATAVLNGLGLLALAGAAQGAGRRRDQSDPALAAD